ncbi:citramalate synthase [Kribbia dieselivorans]|uniref:citramalate synthase n=1 Tax=Kribbia dieselivorans TaxID=331526 RepID=UPI00083903B5|nr:citramalate synthase [Kribbia dieselivorans]
MTSLQVYDTTLRDGAQQEGINLSIDDKLAIAALLDQLGVGFIEGGWPGANPKDTGFFERARTELNLRHSVLAAFGSTRRVGIKAADDPLTRALIDAQTPVVTLVAKSHVGHVERALKTTLDENLAMIRDTTSFLVAEGRRVIIDAEHFFDGWVRYRDYALEAVRAAAESGAEVVALCDTNGGMLPDQVAEAVADVIAATGARVGIHCHNDTGCAVANSMAAVTAGASHVQGTINGYGERTGNANLVTIIANLQLKKGLEVVTPEQLGQLSHVANKIAEVTNFPPYSRQPYIGSSAFAHKAGLHASAIKVDPDMYQHTDPQLVGNDMRMLVSDMAGRASIELKSKEVGIDLDGDTETLTRVLAKVKDLEMQGYTFDGADASFELLLRREVGDSVPDFAAFEGWRAITEARDSSGETASEATIKVRTGQGRVIATGEGNGPVNALDTALRQALTPVYPEIEGIELVDFRVRLLDTSHGTGAITRVLVEHRDADRAWTTIGVGGNLVEAAWEALWDGLSYGLMQSGVAAR